ncbi:TPA: hypothetical protein ACMDO9_003340 [Vibrio cholerae]|nr:hypothetical protein [Vibrio cholerae]
MNKQWLIGALSALMSLSVGAAVDETKVQSRTNAEFQKEISSNFTNLTPDAIAAGLRDLVIIGTVNQGEGSKPDIVWHSISKVVGNEQVAAALSEPLGSPKVKELPKVGEEFDIVGNLDSLLADYLRMMAEAKKNDITLKEEAAEKDSSASSGGSGTSGGYFDNNQTEKPDTGADDFVVKPDTTTKRTVACEIHYDFDKLLASEMAKEETVSSNTNEVVSSTDCAPTGVTYPIMQDYTNAKCQTTTDFTNAKHYLAFRHYIDKSGTGEKAQYVSECKTDIANPLTIKQDISDCGVSENLTTLVTTINKKWYYDDKGAQVFVSDCMPSTETYQIEESDADCVPFLNQNLGTVYTQSQLVWTDDKSVKHKVTECRPSTTELQLSKEYKGTLEHDFVGGVSYEISRDYYIYKGEKIYVNEFSRDPSVSYPHYRTTDGCTTANDDANLRSRLYEKTFITKNGANSVIKDCVATSNYIPYTYAGMTYTDNGGLAGSSRKAIPITSDIGSDFTTQDFCRYANRLVDINGSFSYDKVIGNSSIRKYACSSNKHGTTCVFESYIKSQNENQSYRRFNGSIFNKPVARVCVGE